MATDINTLLGEYNPQKKMPAARSQTVIAFARKISEIQTKNPTPRGKPHGVSRQVFLQRQRFELFFRDQRNQTAERKPLARKSRVLKTLHSVPVVPHAPERFSPRAGFVSISCCVVCAPH
jgi:hypothetical protein